MELTRIHKPAKKKSLPRTAVMIKAKREAAGLSQKDVADKLGYSTPQFISNWERGVSNPPVNTLKKIGELIYCSPEDLFESILVDTVDEIKMDLRRKFASSKSR